MSNGGRIELAVGYKVDKSGLNEIKTSLNELKQLSINDIFNLNTDMTKNQARSLFMTLNNEIKSLTNAFDSAFDPTTGITNLNKLNTNLKSLDLNKIVRDFSRAGEVGEKALNEVAEKAMAANVQFKKSETILDKIGNTFMNTIKWNISSSVVNKFTGSVQQAYGYVQHLDTSLNDIRIVTGKSADEMERFSIKANEAAKNLGSSTTDYTEAALIYYQQGLSDEESQARAETTLKAANVTGQTGQQVSEELTAVWNGYKVTAEETEEYVDKLAAVAASTASDLEELSTGMSKVASAANNMGVDIDQLNAQLATIISVTRQAPETAGTALKTIYARMEDLKISGEDEDGVKLGEVSSTLEEVGISVMDTSGDLRNLGEVIEEVAAHWETWTDAQQNAIAQALAGKRQYNNLLALFDNWDMYTNALETSQGAIGTLQKQQDIYMESTEAHLQKLDTEWEDFYDSILDTSTINTVVDGLTEILSLFDNFIDAIGGGKGAFLLLGGIALTVLRNQIGSQLGQVIINMQGARQEAQQLAGQVANIKLFEGLEEKTPIYAQTITELQSIMSQFYDVLSSEEIEAATNLAKQVAKAKEMEESWDRQAEKVDNLINKIKLLNGSSTDIKSIGSIGTLGTEELTFTTVENINNETSKAKETTQNFYDLLTQISKEYENLREGNESWKDAINKGDFDKKFDSIVEKAKQLQDIFDKLKAAGLIKEEDYKNISKTLNSLSKGTDEFKKNVNQGNKFVGNLTGSLRKSTSEGEKLKTEIKEVTEEIEKTAGEAENMNLNLKGSSDRMAQSFSQALQNAAIKQVTASFTQMAGGISTVAGGLTSLKTGFDTLANSDLSWTDRILGFVTSFGMSTTSIIMGIGNLKTGFSGLTHMITTLNEAEQVELATKLELITVEGAEELKVEKLTVAKALQKLQSEETSDKEKIELATKMGLISAQELQTLTTDEAVVAKIREKIATGQLNAAMLAEIITTKLQTTWEKISIAVKNLWTTSTIAQKVAVIGLTVALVAGVTAYKIYRNAVDSTKERLSSYAEASTKVAEKEEEENKQVQELIEKYKELKEQYDETQVEKLRSAVYDLCIQYGYQKEAVDALVASYDELDGIIDDVHKKQNEESLNAAETAYNANLNKISRFAEDEGDNGWLYKLGKTIATPFTSGAIFDPGIVSSTTNIAQAASMWSDKTINVKGLNTPILDSSGDRQLRQLLESYGITIDNQGNIVADDLSKALVQHGEEIESALQLIGSEGSAQLLKIIDDNSESIEAARNEMQQALSSSAAKIVNIEDIQSLDDYREKFEELATSPEILKWFNGDQDAARDWVQTWFNAIDEVKEYAEKANLVDKVSEALGISPEKLEGYTNSQLVFLYDNANLVKDKENVKEFVDYFNSSIDANNQKEMIVQISAVLNSDTGKEFSDEAISSLFANSSISNYANISEEEFKKLDYEDQKETLKDWIKYSYDKYQEDKQNFEETYNSYDETVRSTYEKIKKYAEENGAEKYFGKSDWFMAAQFREYGGIEIFNDDDTLNVETVKNNIDDIISKMESAGKNTSALKFYKYVIEETGDGLNALYDKVGELDTLSKSFDDESWIQGMSDSLGAAITKVNELEEAYQQGTITLETFTERYLELDKEQDLEGLDIDELNEYSEYLQEVAKDSEDLADSLAEDEAAADIVSKSIVKMNKAVETLSENFEDWSDVLQNSSKSSKEYAEALSGTRSAMADLLDISEDYVSEGFIQSHLEEIGRAAEGDAEAIDSLRDALAEDVVMNFKLNDESIRDDLLSSVTSWQATLDNMDLEVGATVDDASFISAMNEMISTAGLSVDQVNALFDSMGFETTFASTQETLPSTMPKTTVHHERTNIKYEDKDNPKTPTSWDEVETVTTEQVPNDGTYTAFAMSTNGETPKISSITKKATGSFNNSSTTNTGKNSSSSSGSSGSSDSSNEPDTEDYLERTTDLYREINEELDDIESTLGRIQTIDEHSWGASSLAALKEENSLLEEQYNLLTKKKDTYESDLSSQRQSLENQGITFSQDGSVMTNAESKLNTLYAEYNTMVDSYNSMTADEQETYKSTLEAKKETIEDLEDAIDKYEDSYNNYNDVLDKLLDTHYELIENAVNQFNAEIDVKLELDEAEDAWNDFWYDVVQDIDDTDFSGKIVKSIDKLNTYVGQLTGTESSQISSLTDHLNDTITEVNKQIEGANKGGGDSIFKDDTALSKETLTNYRDKLITAVKTAKEEIDSIVENYLNILDDAQDKIDKQVEGWESINDHIEHNLSLIKKVSGSKAYEALNKQFNQQYEANLQLVETQKQSVDYWKERISYYQQMMATENEGSKMYNMYSESLKKASENYRDAVKDLDKSIEDAIGDLEEWRENQVSAIEDAFEKSISKEMGLDLMSEEWDLAIDKQEYYLDNIEKAIELESLQNDFKDALNGLDARNEKQKELLAFMDEENKKLQEKNKLTQYDIDEVKARLEIKKAELALEEAQKNKSNLRLRRDSQGNYNYQYTADTDQIEESESGILSAKKAWYDLVKQRNKETREYIQEQLKTLYSDMEAYNQALADNDYEKAENIKKLIEERRAYILELTSESEKAQRDMFQGTAQIFADTTTAQMLPIWSTALAEMTEKWAGDGSSSFTGAVTQAIEDLQAVQEAFASKTEKILEKAGVNYENLVENGIDPTTKSLNDMQDSNEKLNESLKETNSTLSTLQDNLKTTIDAYNDLKDAAVNAINDANDALNTLANTTVKQVNQIKTAVNTINNANNNNNNTNNTNNNNGNSSNNNNGNNNNGTNTEKTGTRKRYTITRATTKLANGTTGVIIFDNKQGYTISYPSGNRLIGASGTNYSAALTDEKIEELNLEKYRSGGYTGNWNRGISTNEDGRLAVLHQKELVLNQSDTSNMLKMIQAVRDIVQLNHNINASGFIDSFNNIGQMQSSVLSKINSDALQAIASTITTNNSETQNYKNMTVNADFSGVRSADAIYQALVELENYGMQQAYSNAPNANIRY